MRFAVRVENTGPVGHTFDQVRRNLLVTEDLGPCSGLQMDRSHETAEFVANSVRGSGVGIMEDGKSLLQVTNT